MASIDISSKLGKEKKILKLAEGKEYEVNTKADNFLVIQEKFNKKEPTINDMYEMIEVLMGKDALKDIKEMELTIEGLTAVITGLSALISEVSYEEMEKRMKNPR